MLYTISKKHLTLKCEKSFLLFNNFDLKKNLETILFTKFLKGKSFIIMLNSYSKILVW
jgi:hypothetical protein